MSKYTPGADELDGDVVDLVAGGAHAPGRLGQQHRPGGALPPRFGGAEVGAKVPQPRGGEEGVAAGVGDDVAVGVALQARFARPGQAGQVQGRAGFGDEGVSSFINLLRSLAVLLTFATRYLYSGL